MGDDQHTVAFDDAPTGDRGLLGGKGAGLVEMTALGFPVPPGFVITTACGRAYRTAGELPASLDIELSARVAALEESAGRSFGDDERPLLVSVRSGAPVSMPGMMDTILNVGLNDAATRALAAETGSDVVCCLVVRAAARRVRPYRSRRFRRRDRGRLLGPGRGE